MNINDTSSGTSVRLSDFEAVRHLDGVEWGIAITLAATVLATLLSLWKARSQECSARTVERLRRSTVVLTGLSATGVVLVGLRAVSSVLWMLAIYVPGAAREGMIAITIAKEVRLLSWAVTVVGVGALGAWFLKQIRRDKEAPTIGSSVFLTRGTPLAGQESRRGSESAEP